MNSCYYRGYLTVLRLSTVMGVHSKRILTKIHSRLQGFVTKSSKAINSTVTIQEIPRPTIYPTVEQTLRSSQFVFSRT